MLKSSKTILLILNEVWFDVAYDFLASLFRLQKELSCGKDNHQQALYLLIG